MHRIGRPQTDRQQLPPGRGLSTLFNAIKRRITVVRQVSLAIATAVIAGVLLAVQPSPEASAGEAQDRDARFQSGVNLISVTATVVDGEGKLVTGLPKEAFEIFEEGERQTITQFTNERVPVSLAVLLDVSDSMFGQRLVDARAAVERFLFDLLDEEDEFSVVAFNHEPRALTNWTRDAYVVKSALAELKPFGSTALYDAVLTALPMMNTRTKQRASVLIISDGADTASDAGLRDLRSALIRSDAFVYAIAVDPPAKRAINETVNVNALNEITGGSGGNTELVHQTTDLVVATARIAEELNKQYVLGYHSPLPLDGTYRSIRVRSTNSEYRVRARRGYIATPRKLGVRR
jgi:Ca-activated chloride channel family protein